MIGHFKSFQCPGGPPWHRESVAAGHRGRFKYWPGPVRSAAGRAGAPGLRARRRPARPRTAAQIIIESNAAAAAAAVGASTVPVWRPAPRARRGPRPGARVGGLPSTELTRDSCGRSRHVPTASLRVMSQVQVTRV